MYNSITHHLYIVSCIHHPKSSLPSSFILLYPLLPPPPLPFRMVVTVLLSVSMGFFRFYLFIFREKRREEEKERNIDVPEIHQLVASRMPTSGGTWPTTQACALTENRTSSLSVHRLALNPLSHTSQGYEFFVCLFLLNPFTFFTQPLKLPSPLTAASLFSVSMSLFLFCLFHGMGIPHIVYSLTSLQTFGMFPPFGCYE